jgi:hypothetical protein
MGHVGNIWKKTTCERRIYWENLGKFFGDGDVP